MASGSSGRSNAGSKGYDFGTDDILCSYDDFSNQESSNGSHSDPVIGTNSSKEFNKSRMSRSSVFPTNTYGQQEESLSQEVISTVEKSMKKYADNLMRFLEGISSRLSQLELYCYNLDKSIGEMRSDLVRDHGESDSKLKSLEKHLQEVHRSVQILRDKQELAETQKELAKLQLVQKDSSKEERSTPRVSDSKKTDNPSDSHNQQLALALPHQVAPPTRPMEHPVAAVPSQTSQPQSYYLPTTPAPASAPAPHGQYLSSDPQYRTPQQPTQSQVNQTPPTPQQVHPFPQYQQQWAPTQVRPPSSTPVYPSSYPTSQSANPSPAPYPPSQSANLPPPPSETLQSSSMPMQVPFTGIPQGASRADVMNYSYGGAGRTAQQLPPQHMKSNFGDYTSPPPSGAYPGGNNAYMMYDSEGGRTHLPPTPQPQPQPQPQQAHFSQGGGYPPTSGSLSLQNPQVNTGSNLMVRNQSAPQFVRNHPYNDLVEKLVNMGYRGDHVVSVIQRMEENGQPVDFNTVLDRLNGHSSGASQRGGWSA